MPRQECRRVATLSPRAVVLNCFQPCLTPWLCTITGLQLHGPSAGVRERPAALPRETLRIWRYSPTEDVPAGISGPMKGKAKDKAPSSSKQPQNGDSPAQQHTQSQALPVQDASQHCCRPRGRTS